MSEGQPREETGEFSEEITEQDVLKAFDIADEPFLTATEIAATLPVTRAAVNYRLNRMRESGLVGRKDVGARAVGWWSEVGPRLAEETERVLETTEDELESEGRCRRPR